MEKLNAALNFALNQPNVKQRLVDLGMAPAPMTPAQAMAFIESEQKVWWPIVEATNAN